MASTKITLKEAEEILIEFNKAYRHFYQSSDELLLLVNERTKAKEHDFYEQISKDSKEFIKEKGFSNSWVWGLFFEEKEQNRNFHNPYLRAFEKLIVFYKEHIFIEYNEDRKAVFKKANDEKKLKKSPITITQVGGIKRKRPLLLIIVIVVFLISIGTSWFNSSKSIEEINVSEKELCKTEKKPQDPSIIFFPFKENQSSNNKGYANKLYEQISSINKRDSLGIEIIYCDVFKEYQTQEEAYSTETNYHKYLSNFDRRDSKTFVLYNANENFESSINLGNFQEFRKRTLSIGQTIYVPKVYNENQFIFNCYHQIVLALVSKGDKKNRKKAINYINTILLQDNIAKEDLKLLEIRSKLKLYTNDRVGQVEDLNLILSIDSTNTSALYNLANFNFYKKDSSALGLYKKYLKILPNHCNVLSQLAKSYVIFDNDFIKAHEIIDGKNSISKTKCEFDDYYYELKGKLFILENKYQEAIDVLMDGYIKKANRRRLIAMLLAQAYFLNEDYKKAEEVLLDLDKPNSTDFKQKQYLAMVYRKLNRSDLAIKSLQAKNIRNFENSYLKTHLYLEQDSTKKALKELDKAIEVFAYNEDIKYLLNYRRIANNRLKNKRFAILDSLKILDYDPLFFKEKKEQANHPLFKFNSIFSIYLTKEDDVPLIRK